MKAASSRNTTSTFISRLTIASIAGALTITGLGFVAAPELCAETPADQTRAAGAIPLTTELFDKMEKFFTAVKSEAAAKAEIVAVMRENKDTNPPTTGEAWGSLISAKCPKTVEILEASGLTPEECGKAGFAIEAIMFADGMAPPGDKDNMAKSADKTAAANAAFYGANKARAEAIYGNFGILGIQ
jgi:hypothetical protein